MKTRRIKKKVLHSVETKSLDGLETRHVFIRGTKKYRDERMYFTQRLLHDAVLQKVNVILRTALQ